MAWDPRTRRIRALGRGSITSWWVTWIFGQVAEGSTGWEYEDGSSFASFQWEDQGNRERHIVSANTARVAPHVKERESRYSYHISDVRIRPLVDRLELWSIVTNETITNAHGRKIRG